MLQGIQKGAARKERSCPLQPAIGPAALPYYSKDHYDPEYKEN